jgi:predicted DNA-binding protein with PD1-like motif
MVALSTNIKRLIMLRLNPGDDILLSLRQAVKDHNIRSGVIMTGVGSVSGYHYHVVDSTDLPPAEAFPKADEPCDVIAMAGLIIDGRVHAHITFAKKEQALGGHLEEGCRVLTFAVIVLAETPDIQFTDWDKIGEL